MAAVDDGTIVGWLIRGLLALLLFILGLFTKLRTKQIDDKHKEIKDDLSAQGTRIDGEIKELKDSSVTRREFEQYIKRQDERFVQHAKHQDERHEAILLILKDTVKLNTAEHSRICGKMDAIPSMVKDEVDRAMKSIRREILALNKKDNI